MEDPCDIKPFKKTSLLEEYQKTQMAILSISGLNCPNCAIRVRNALLKTYGVTTALIDHETGLGEIAFNPDIVQPGNLVSAIVQAGNDGMHQYSAQFLE
jgi:copper chaperone CopZ